MSPRTKRSQSGTSASQLSMMKTRFTKSFTPRRPSPGVSISKGGRLGRYSSPVNSCEPSTLKCAHASGSSQSLVRCL